MCRKFDPCRGHHNKNKGFATDILAEPFFYGRLKKNHFVKDVYPFHYPREAGVSEQVIIKHGASSGRGSTPTRRCTARRWDGRLDRLHLSLDFASPPCINKVL